MIRYLNVRNFKLAEAVELEFEPGFTVLTGETGAGKSLMVDALALLLGRRASPESISGAAERAEIQGVFELPEGHPARAWLAERSLDADECVLRRVIARASPSRAFINGGAASAQELRALGQFLVDIHGQNDHQLLTSRDRQREMLDAFAGHEAEVASLTRTFARLKAMEERFDALRGRGDARRERARLLEFQIGELESLRLEPGEERDLTRRHDRLAHAKDLMQGLAQVLSTLSDGESGSVEALVDSAARTIAGLVPYDERLKDAAARLDGARIDLTELAADLRRLLDGYEFDPQALHAAQRRLEQLHDAARKYRVEIAGLEPLLGEFRAERAEISSDEDDLAALQREIDAHRDRHRTLARDVGRRRRRAAGRFDEQVAAELAALGMAGAAFHTALNPLEAPRAHGFETPEFLFGANPGQASGPLSRVASGGELSRVALSINVVSGRGLGALTQVYDEVDAGIGGGVAEMVGQKLRALADSRQVLCVTHLPQVASQAQHHKKVAKGAPGSAAVSVATLDDDARGAEIARMLGGLEITDRTLDHADEMLKRARQ